MHTKTLGPGTRAAIWLQGCKRSCKGCMSLSTRPMNGGFLASISKLCESILTLKDIEGVTVSGGEPFLQPEALFVLLRTLRENSDLGVIVYTGYTLEQLRGLHDPLIDQILDEMVDLLIDGEYVDELNDGMGLKGSSNQRLLFLTDRYLPYREIYERKVRNIEVMMSEEEIFVIGIPNRETWRQWETAAGEVRTAVDNGSEGSAGPDEQA